GKFWEFWALVVPSYLGIVELCSWELTAASGEGRGGLHQQIVRVDVIDVFRRDQLVLDEHGRRDGAAIEDVERHGHDLGAVFLGEIGNRSDQPGFRLA